MDPTHEFGEIAYFQRRMFSYINSKTSTHYPLAKFDVVSFSRQPLPNVDCLSCLFDR